MSNPYFSPHSVYWRVNREWLIALGGPCAVFLELAHPAVAAGVAQHSRYETDPFGRLYRTFKTMTDITFGDAQEARAALGHFHRCHAAVHSAPGDAAIVYDANDPALKLWVWATLVDTVLRVHERFVTPLSDADTCAYYGDAARLARLLGIPHSILPTTYAGFRWYMHSMLAGDTLRVTDQARAVTDALLHVRGASQLTRAFCALSIGMLPARLRAEYGFEWNAADAWRAERFAALARSVRPWLPEILAAQPKAIRMERRMGSAR